MRIAVFDNYVVRNNPAGSCHRKLLEALCDKHDFTVFAVEFDNPRPDRIRFVRVPAVGKPLFLLFIVYQLMSRVLWHRLRRRQRFDLVQVIECKGPPGDIVYQHFCHRHFLRHSRWSWRPRPLARRLNHVLHAALEGRYLRRARAIVVPSHGLAKEIAQTHGAELLARTHVIPNPVDTAYFKPCSAEDRARYRGQLGLPSEALVLVFTALGDFERKGLPLLLDVLSDSETSVRLIVVGGNEGLVEDFRQRCRDVGLTESQVIFTGRVADVRPFYWAADLFCLPSQYETFSLVAYEAAACGLPLLVTALHGVEELVRDGVNGWTIPPDVAAWRARIAQCGTDRLSLAAIGAQASADVRALGLDRFALRWDRLYLDNGVTDQRPTFQRSLP